MWGRGEVGVGADGGDCVVWAYVGPVEALERDDLGRPTEEMRSTPTRRDVGVGHSLGIARNDPQRRGRMYTPVQQESTLVIRNVPPFRRMVLFPTGDVDDHLQIPEQNRAERTGTVGDELCGSDDSRFVCKVLDGGEYK